MSRSWDWVARSESTPGMATYPTGDTGPAASQHRASCCTHTAQGSPGMHVCLGGARKAMSGVRDCLCQIHFIFLHGTPVLIGKQPEREPKMIVISARPISQSTHRAQGKQGEGCGRTSAQGNVPGLFLPLPGPGSSKEG